ncbi:MAG: hypothetical protein JRN15_09585, partial [Nitrososphaerota archaeon]|nr:hypothetical protein [Nitrososphaerota archaeon]
MLNDILLAAAVQQNLVSWYDQEIKADVLCFLTRPLITMILSYSAPLADDLDTSVMQVLTILTDPVIVDGKLLITYEDIAGHSFDQKRRFDDIVKTVFRPKSPFSKLYLNVPQEFIDKVERQENETNNSEDCLFVSAIEVEHATKSVITQNFIHQICFTAGENDLEKKQQRELASHLIPIDAELTHQKIQNGNFTISCLAANIPLTTVTEALGNIDLRKAQKNYSSLLKSEWLANIDVINSAAEILSNDNPDFFDVERFFWHYCSTQIEVNGAIEMEFNYTHNLTRQQRSFFDIQTGMVTYNGTNTANHTYYKATTDAFSAVWLDKETTRSIVKMRARGAALSFVKNLHKAPELYAETKAMIAIDLALQSANENDDSFKESKHITMARNNIRLWEHVRAEIIKSLEKIQEHQLLNNESDINEL